MITIPKEKVLEFYNFIRNQKGVLQNEEEYVSKLEIINKFNETFEAIPVTKVCALCKSN